MKKKTPRPALHAKVEKQVHEDARAGNGGKPPAALLDANGKPRKIDNRPEDRAYRRRWMEHYNAEKKSIARPDRVGSVTSQCAKAAAKAVDASAPAAKVKADVAKKAVVAMQKRAPAPPRTPAPPPRNDRCSIVLVDAWCQHDEPEDALLNRGIAALGAFLSKAPAKPDPPEEDKHRHLAGGVLQIVPDAPKNSVTKGADSSLERSVEQGASRNMDTVTLTATMHHGCGAHPTWRIVDDAGQAIATRNGTSASYAFSAPVVTAKDVPHFLGVWWLKNVQPRRYRIDTMACCGPGDSVNIAIYPDISSGFKTDLIKKAPPLSGWEKTLDLYRTGLNDTFEILKDVFPNVRDIECKLLEGSLELKNAWEEGRHNEAVWTASASIGFDPLFSIEVKISIIPLNVPKALRDYCDLGFYLGIKGEWTAEFEGSWNREEVTGGGSSEGALTLSLGAEVKLAPEYEIIDVDAHADSTVALEGNLEFNSEPQIELKCTATWKPMTVVVTLKLFKGWIKPYEGSWELFEEKSCDLGSLKLLPD